MVELEGRTVGFALAGSHCTLEEIFGPLRQLRQMGATIVPIISHTVDTVTTRFGSPEDWKRGLREISGREPLCTIPEVEPLGPQRALDCVVVAPCTGNTMARIANALTDTPVVMAVKATLRNQRPVVLAISTNDGLGLNAHNLAKLLNAKNVYFVPFGQDNPQAKPNSLVAHFDLLVPTVLAALEGRQYQPLLVPWT
ncbi:MAG: dipicolinate synthase subunit B [Clostridia bacterium]|nr:dipicolinate synthase subunit B [Clostridia bacterium]